MPEKVYQIYILQNITEHCDQFLTLATLFSWLEKVENAMEWHLHTRHLFFHRSVARSCSDSCVDRLMIQIAPLLRLSYCELRHHTCDTDTLALSRDRCDSRR